MRLKLGKRDTGLWFLNLEIPKRSAMHVTGASLLFLTFLPLLCSVSLLLKFNTPNAFPPLFRSTPLLPQVQYTQRRVKGSLAVWDNIRLEFWQVRARTHFYILPHLRTELRKCPILRPQILNHIPTQHRIIILSPSHLCIFYTLSTHSFISIRAMS